MKKGLLITIIVLAVVIGLIFAVLLRNALLPWLEDDNGNVVYRDARYDFSRRFRADDSGRVIGRTSSFKVREIDPAHVFLDAQEKFLSLGEYFVLARADAEELFCKNVCGLYTKVRVRKYEVCRDESIETREAEVINAFTDAWFSDSSESMSLPGDCERLFVYALNDEFPGVEMIFTVYDINGAMYLGLAEGRYAALPQAAADWLREVRK